MRRREFLMLMGATALLAGCAPQSSLALRNAVDADCFVVCDVDGKATLLAGERKGTFAPLRELGSSSADLTWARISHVADGAVIGWNEGSGTVNLARAGATTSAWVELATGADVGDFAAGRAGVWTIGPGRNVSGHELSDWAKLTKGESRIPHLTSTFVGDAAVVAGTDEDQNLLLETWGASGPAGRPTKVAMGGSVGGIAVDAVGTLVAVQRGFGSDGSSGEPQVVTVTEGIASPIGSWTQPGPLASMDARTFGAADGGAGGLRIAVADRRSGDLLIDRTLDSVGSVQGLRYDPQSDSLLALQGDRVTRVTRSGDVSIAMLPGTSLAAW